MITILIVIAVVIGVVIAAALLYLASLDGSYEVRRSLAMAAGRKTVFDKIRDLRSWKDWSPWLLHEPDAAMEYSAEPDQEGGWYTWDGARVGAGRLTHVRFDGEQGIEQRIEFMRPFRSVCRVWWELERQADDSTVVHWNMAGRMPFLFRFMARKIPALIGKDYATGLYLLRAELVAGEEVPRISFDGVATLPEQTAITIAFEGHLEAMKTAMQEGFPQLQAYLADNAIEPTGPPFSVYHQVDTDSMHFSCDMAVPVPAGTRGGACTVKTFAGGEFYKVELRGSYEFLELAWYQAYSHLQMIKLRPQSSRASREVYENDARAVGHSNEIETSLYIPVR